MPRKHWLIAAATCVAILPATGGANVTETDFQVRTTADLVDLCSASPSDPMGTAALNFCHGFAVGVYRVLEEENAAKRVGRMFCIPDGRCRRATRRSPTSCNGPRPARM